MAGIAIKALVSSSLSSTGELGRKQLLLGGKALVVPHSTPSASSKRASFVVRAASDKPVKQGDRQLWFASKQSLSYLDGSLPGDYGFDPLGLMDPEGPGGFMEPSWLAYGEIINGRYAMLGAVGAIAPEIFGKVGLIPQETAVVWFRTGVIPPAGSYNYWADPYTLFVLEMALMGFAEHRRLQDYYKPGSMSKQYFLGLEKYLGGSGNPAYPGGPLRFRTRSTEVVRLVDLLDEAKNRSKQELIKRGKEDEWTPEELENAAEAIGYGAVKYADLKNNRLTNYTFNFDQMLDVRGNTAVYLLYAHARICSIIRKSGKDIEELKKAGSIQLIHENERLLGVHLIQFSEIVEDACTELLPNILCEYLYNLSENFAKFYSTCKVVGSEEETSRLLLCEATAIVMRECFKLLGITPLYKL